MNQVDKRLRALEQRLETTMPQLILAQGRATGEYSADYYHDEQGNIYMAAEIAELGKERQIILIEYTNIRPPGGEA